LAAQAAAQIVEEEAERDYREDWAAEVEKALAYRRSMDQRDADHRA
jgi:hypothetical protein